MLLSHWAGPTATAWEQYVWSIYSLETGDRVAELSRHSSSAPFFLWGARLVHESRPYGRLIDGNWIEEPLTIRAIDVATGAELWKRPIRDTRYRGPYPPSNHPPG